MTVAKERYLSLRILEDIVLPTGEILSQEPQLESYLHLQQIRILLSCLELLWKNRNDFFAAGNLSIYYNPLRIRTKKFIGPDFFVVLNTEWKPRTSWTVWEENNRYPNVIVEVLSPKTAKKDKGEKKLLYQDIFRTPEYFYFSPRTLEFQGFRLKNGEYEKLKRNEQGRLWSQELGLCLGVHEGFLRYFEVTGKLVPRPEESSEASEQRADEEAAMRQIAQQRAIQFEQIAESEASMREIAQQRADEEAAMRQIAEQRAESEKLAREKLAAKLRELGIDPDSI
jgi:Uma2 family endonuclease